MNKIKKTIIALSLATGIGGASYFAFAEAQTNNDPSSSITAFYDNAKKGELDQAKEYVAAEVVQYYKNGTWLAGTISEGIKREAGYYKKVDPLEDTVKINGQTATIDVKVTNEDGSIEIKPYDLVKEEGKWKLTFQ